MATNYVCKLCGSPSPPVFALSSTDKIPLCADDIGKYISTQHFASQTIFPIAAIAFIDSVSDLPLFEQRNEAMNKSDRVIDQWIAIEKDQFQEAVLKLQLQAQNAVVVVHREYQVCIQKLRNLHEALTTQLTTSKTEINQAKFAKIAALGRIAEMLVNEREAVNAAPVFFSESVHEVEKQLSKTVQASVTLPTLDAEQFLLRFFSRKAEVFKSKQIETPHPFLTYLKEAVPHIPFRVIAEPQSSPVPEKRDEKRCLMCDVSLTPANSTSLIGHEKCFVCFDCIKTKNHIRLRCPVCQAWLTKDSKEILEAKIPELKTMLENNKIKSNWAKLVKRRHSKKRRHKKKEAEIASLLVENKEFEQIKVSPSLTQIVSTRANVWKTAPLKCAICAKTCETEYHRCRLEVVCLDCFERELVENCFEQHLSCPTCGALPNEVLGNREAKKCSLCRKLLKLNEVAHWCDDNDFLVCGVCYSDVVIKGRCEYCGEDIKSDSDSEVESD